MGNQHTHTQQLNMFSVTQKAMSVRVNSGDNFGAPARDNTESFKGSTAGNSNWNSYEGGDDKKLTKEEKKALNEKAEAESKARRAAAAIKLQAEKDAWMKEQAQ